MRNQIIWSVVEGWSRVLGSVGAAGWLSLAIATCVFAQGDPEIPDWLEFVEEIRIPRDSFDGHPMWPDFNGQGGVVFSAHGKVFYHSGKTKQLQVLDPHRCRPDAQGQSYVAMFTPDGEIVVGVMHDFYWFDFEGKCVKYRTGNDALSPSSLPLEGRRLLHSNRVRGAQELRLVDAEGKTVVQRVVDDLPMPNRSAGTASPIVHADGRYLISGIAAPVVAAYDADLKLTGVSNFEIPELPWPDADIPSEMRGGYNPDFIREIMKYARVGEILVFKDNLFGLIAGFTQSDFVVLQLFDRDGKAVKQERLSKNFGALIKAVDGYAYAWGEDDDSMVKIRVYKVGL